MARKRPKRSKPLPEILKTPFQYKLDFLHNFTGDLTPAAEAEGRRIWAEVIAKVRAVAKYYDVNIAKIDPTSDLFNLIIAMACAEFPGFQFKPEGAPNTKRTQWTADRKIELLDVMRKCIGKGMTLEKAANVYSEVHKAIHGRTLDPRGIITRFKEAEAWEKTGELTAFEALELFKRMQAAIGPTAARRTWRPGEPSSPSLTSTARCRSIRDWYRLLSIADWPDWKQAYSIGPSTISVQPWPLSRSPRSLTTIAVSRIAAMANSPRRSPTSKKQSRWTPPTT